MWRRMIVAASLAVLAAACAQPKPQTMPVAWQQPSANPTLDKLVAPIALYPDALVAQILPASTNPSQVVAAAAAVTNGQRPSAATAAQWDPAIQALLSYPTVLKMMNDRIDWTTQLGQAVQANQPSVMSAIQTVRSQAQAVGNLASSSQQTVQTVDGSIIIEPADPAYIYVPQYDPVTILQPWPAYAYGPAITFGVGFAAGAATAYACHWGGYGYSSVTVNNSYHYNYANTYPPYHANYGANYGAYHPSTNTYTGYDAKTGTYGSYNASTGHYSSYNPSTGDWNHDGNTGTYHGGTTSPDDAYHPDTTTAGASHAYGSSSAWGDHSSWGSGGGSGGDAFHGMDGGGWGAQDASNRGASSFGGSDDHGWGGGGDDRGFGGGGGGWGGGDHGFGGGGDRSFGGGGGFGGGGFRGGGFGGRR